MFRSLLSILAFLVMFTPAGAQSNSDIEGVIGKQLEAFNSRDVTEAWQYAAPNIQRLFGTPQNFGMMVERGYPMVWTNQNVEFLESEEFNSVTVQRLRLQDTAGGLHILEYQMVQTDEGWRIAGVQILELPDVGV